MTKVTVEYLQANGRYRIATAHTESQWPNFLINHHDKQAHSLVDSPVYPDDKKRSFRTWDQLVEAPPPSPAHYPNRLLCVCEDQNVWPVSNNVQPDTQDRQLQYKEFCEDGEQVGVVTAARSAANAALINAWSIASLMIFCVVSAVILLVALQSDLAQQFRDSVGPAAALVFLMGGLKIRRRAAPPKDWETLRVYDEVAGFPWSCSMPLSELSTHLPIECRYTQEPFVPKIIGGAVFGGALFALAFLAAMIAGWHIFWVVVAPIFASLPGMLFGFAKGYETFMQPPVWVARRVYATNEVKPGEFVIDYESMPVIIPESHTMLTGMPLPLASAERRAEAEAVIKSATSGGGNGRAVSAVVTKQNIAMAYTPRIWRAYMLYEQLKARDVKARMRGPNFKGDKLQRLSMAGMALGSLGILVVALLLLG